MLRTCWRAATAAGSWSGGGWNRGSSTRPRLRNMRAFESAIHARDVEAAIACFAPDIIIRSPVTQRIRFVGIEQGAEIFRFVFARVSDVRVYLTVGEGESAQVLFWRGRIGRHYLEEANLLQLDAQGRICEMTVFMRPVPGLLAMGAWLGTSLAARRGKARRFAVSFLLDGIAAAYAIAEPVVIALVGAGRPVPEVERRSVPAGEKKSAG
jgi:hypothetical protein